MHLWPHSGIFRKILFSILTVSLVPLVVLGVLTLRSTGQAGTEAVAHSREALDAKSAEALELWAIETANAVRDFLYEREADLKAAARLPRSTDAFLAFYQAHQRELWFLENGQEVHQQVPLYREMALLDATGQEVIKILDGQVVGPEELQDVSDPSNTLYKSETYFVKARQLPPGEIYVSHVTGFYVNQAASEAGARFVGVLRFAMPLYTQEGYCDGVLVLALDSRHLEEFTAHIVTTEERFAVVSDPATANYAYIIDDRSAVIAHPDDSIQWGVDQGGQTLPWASRAEEIGSLPVLLSHLGFADENLPRIHELASQGNQGSIQYHWAGHDKFVAYAPIAYYGGPYGQPAGFGWAAIGANVETFHRAASSVGETIQDRVRLLTTSALIILGLTGLAVVVTAGVLARNMSVPIQQLTAAVRAAEQGDLAVARQAALGVRAKDELGTLADGFNQMAAQLQETLVGLEQELAERRRAEEALQQSEERYRTLIEQSNDAIYFLFERRFEFINQRFEEMFGESREQVLSPDFDFMSLIAPRSHPLIEERNRRIQQEEPVPRRYEFTALTKDGREIEVEASVSHTPYQGGTATQGILRDITERKRAELELEAYRDQLEEMVEKRTLELKTAKEELEVEIKVRRQAEEAAKQASQAKSEFLSNISHELRTPLNGILGYAQILQRSPGLSAAQMDGLEIIYQSGNHLLTLIDDILDLAKIEARKMELYPTTIHFPGFLNSIVDIMRMRAHQKGLQFTCEIDNDLPSGIEADEKRLRQILLNLLGNAVKYTDEGRVTLRVHSKGYEGTGEQGFALPSVSYALLRFEVKDTGVGMAPDQLERVFLPFEQAGDVDRRIAGAGLGLSISQQLVEMMSSNIQVSSELGKGSTFWFEVALPAVEIKAQDEGIAWMSITGYEGSRRSVLVVDDKPHNCLVLLNMLEPLGFEVEMAENGLEGVAKAREMRRDLILMDLIMPVMSGFEAVREIRAIPELSDVPIIAVSASAFDMDQEKSRQAGCDAFLPKPIDTAKLLALMEEHLRLTWVYAEPEAPCTAKDEVTPQPEAVLVVPPPPEELEALYELAMFGSMPRIQERAMHLEEMDTKYTPFANKLRQFAENFEDERILAFLEQFMEERE